MEIRKLKSIYILFISVIISFSCSTSDKTKKENFDTKRLTWIKDYSFCQYLMYSLGDSIKSQTLMKDHSLSTLVDIANIWTMTEDLNNIAMQYVDSIPNAQISDFQNQKPYLLRCLEFRRSIELEKEIINLLKENKL